MSDWLDLLADPRPLRAVYGTEVPALEAISLVSVSLSSDGHRVSVVFDLAEFPQQPPAGWIRDGANTLQLALTFEDTIAVQLHGPVTPDPAELTLTRNADGAGVSAELRSAALAITVTSRWLWLDRMSAYRNTERDVPGEW